ncbi:MAG: TatD family hydrolase [Clostridiales Family XIII bacterium]|jgi:TatD DNase family protein|nr:TatD family hydrolase [Clostridiales Family XIII bacterium]
MAKILFDTHAHINSDDITPLEKADWIERIGASEVAYVVDVAFDMASSRVAIEDAEKNSWCYAAVGVHPHDSSELTAVGLSELREMSKHPKVVAIGEIGLDYYRNLSPVPVQRDAFRKQIRLALELGMPITIHDRDSKGEAVAILEEEGAFSDERKSQFPANPVTGIRDARVLLHCFSGSGEQAVELAKKGATISVAGPVTFKNSKKTRSVATKVPLEHLVIETDSPYLTPEPHRGTQNLPVYVEFVARKIAELREISYEEVAAVTLANAKRFYGI